MRSILALSLALHWTLVFFDSAPVSFLIGAESAFFTAPERLKPLIRWAPHSALISLHGTPQTFSV